MADGETAGDLLQSSLLSVEHDAELHEQIGVQQLRVLGEQETGHRRRRSVHSMAGEQHFIYLFSIKFQIKSYSTVIKKSSPYALSVVINQLELLVCSHFQF